MAKMRPDNCPKCKAKKFTRIKWHDATREETVGAAWGGMHHVKNIYVAAAKIGFFAVKAAAQAAASKVYQCDKCNHRWRIWVSPMDKN